MDGSARFVSNPSRRRAPPRTGESLPECIPSKWDKTGRLTGAPEIRRACMRATRLWSPVAAKKELLHFPLDLHKRGVQRLSSGIDHQSALRIQLVQEQTHSFPHAPPDPVANDRLPQRARRREAHARPVLQRIADVESREKRTHVSGSPIINSAKLRRP